MRVIGLTGGVGAGKSQVLNFLKEEYNAQVIQADLVARWLMEPGEPGYRQVVNLFGSAIVREDGTIDRPLLAKLMFEDKEALNQVNAVIHPAVWAEIKRQILLSPSSLVVVEAALLQKERDDIYDELWYLYTSRENRIQRLKEHRDYSEEKALSIMESQPSEEEFRSHCSRVIDNNRDFNSTREQIQAIMKERRTEP